MRRAKEVVTGVAVGVCLLGAGFAEQEATSCTMDGPNHYVCEFVEDNCTNSQAMSLLCGATAYFYGWSVEGVVCGETGGSCLFHLPG